MKSFSHSIIIKIITFVAVLACFTGAIISFLNLVVSTDGNFDVISKDNYFMSSEYAGESQDILGDLTRLIGEFKSEENILKGNTVTEEELRNEEENLFREFQEDYRSYNPALGELENYKAFKAAYADRIAQAKDRLIQEDLRGYNFVLQRLQGREGLLYYVSDGKNVYTNSPNAVKEDFKNYPSYMIFEKHGREIYPDEVKNNERFHWILSQADQLNPVSDTVYMSFTKESLNPKIEKWKTDKVIATNSLYRFIGFLAGLILTFAYLVLIIGRKYFKDQDVNLTAIDRLYNDINLVLCIMLIILWFACLQGIGIRTIDFYNSYKVLIPITVPIAAIGLVLVLAQVKHLKNRTFLKHTLIFSILYQLYKFIRNVYASGSVGIKTVLIVIGYPILVGLTFFMFPVTLAVAAWFAFKKVKSFSAIQEGVERIKAGDIHHFIPIEGDGEFGRLAANINSITDGLQEAVASELKSERLKTELITNVSHDIRTPLTSIITYVDLLKKEKDPAKVEEYIEVLEQKSQRLKTLTDDLFEAAKASSGNIPVTLERIDIVSLLTQGLGELNDKIEASDLEFKVNHPKDNIYVMADGKLLWRAVENLLSNIFKYALKGSRVYVDLEELGNEVRLTVKNISATELNISADELTERFKRGDESRSTQGSGLGLSIAKSLVEAQKGKFQIQVDGDLFKATVYMPKYK